MKKKHESKAKAKLNTKPPKSRCFRCDGTGHTCNVCGESERACECAETDLGECPDCKGTGR